MARGFFGIGVIAVSLVVLSACSNVHKANQASPQAKQEAVKLEVAKKAQQIAQLNEQKKAEQKRAENAKKQLPILLAQSDSAMKLSNQFKTLAAKEKKTAKKLDLEQHANKAQKIADDKASELVNTHKSIYDSAGNVRELDAKIATLTAQKKQAEQLAMGNVRPASTNKRM